MKRWWIVLGLVACNKRHEEPARVPVGAGSGALVAPADAQLVDMVAPPPIDATVTVPADGPAGPAPVDVKKLLDVEVIGPLRWGMSQDQAINALGKPQARTPPVEEGATGEFASNWTWPGVTLEMVSETRSGAARVRLITIAAPTTPEAQGMIFATARGIRIGSTLAEVAARYPRSDEGGDEPDQFLVGSQFGGLLFVLKNDVVVEISLGPFGF